MNVDKYSASKFLAQEDQVFVIPVFQRNYSWNEDNWQRLYDDLTVVATSSSPYFIGTVCMKTHGPSKDEVSVIDGQQRIMTISLLLIALHDVTTDEHLKVSIEQHYLFNTGYGVDLAHRNKLRPSRSDAASYERVLSDGDKVFGDKSADTTLVEDAYCWFRKQLDAVESDMLGDLYKALKLVEVAVLDCGDEDPQVIFESLNSTGVSLEPVDLLRNYLLMGLPSDEQTRLYVTYWLPIEKNVGFSNMASFFADALIYWRQSHKIVLSSSRTIQVTSNTIYEAYREWYGQMTAALGVSGKSLTVAESLLKSLLSYSKLYSELCFDGSTARYDLDDFHRSIYDLLIVNKCSSARPMLLWILTKRNSGCIDDDVAIKMVQAMITYVVRMRVCGVRGKGLNSQYVVTMFLSLSREDDDKKYTIGAFWRALSVGQNTASLRSDKEFYRELQKASLFTVLRSQNYLVWFLSEIERALSGSSNVRNLDDLHVVRAVNGQISDGSLSTLGFSGRSDFENIQDTLCNAVLVEQDIDVSGDTVLSADSYGLDMSDIALNQALVAEGRCSKHALLDVYGKALASTALRKVWSVPKAFASGNRPRLVTGRRTNFKFWMAGVAFGEYVTFRQNSAVRAKVVDDSHVQYKGRKWSLSELASHLLNKKNVRGPEFFMYEGELLSDLRDENGY